MTLHKVEHTTLYDKNYKSAVKNTKENDIVNWAKYYTSHYAKPYFSTFPFLTVLNKYNKADGTGNINLKVILWKI